MLRLLASCLGAVVCLSAAAAQPTTAVESPIPPALKDWRAWVLKDLDYRTCPFLASAAPSAADTFVCAWPGRLTLSSNADGATFSIHWRVEAPSWVALPGDAERWPQQVTVNGQRQPVLEHDGRPELSLLPGSYEIAGRIPWREQPQTIAVPQGIGLVALNVDGKPVSPIRRDGNQLTLGRATTSAPEADNLDLRVYRKLSDGVPAQLSTRIVVLVAGQAREEVIGPVLPEGFVPVALSSAWPARLDGDGRLHLQVQPGAETLTIDARATGALASVTARVPAKPWPKQEVWSYEGAPRLRVTAAGSALQLDPRQAEVPQDWQTLPAFALADGAKLTIEERSRGIAPDEGNRLTLQREAWLDFDGGGWFARDRVNGRMAQGWRLDVAAPFTLERASANNLRRTDAAGEPLLVTRGADAALSGVEWRTPNVDLAAGVRVASAASMPVAGWQQTFDGVQATLHFPFGYKLLGASGADAANGSWASGWNLLDAFVCAITVLLAWRLSGGLGAGATVLYLLLGYQESGAPLWSLIAALGLALVARALPEGKLSRSAGWLRRGALLWLVLAALPFLACQVRFALYPQLESGGYSFYAPAEAVGGFKDEGKVAAEMPVAARLAVTTEAAPTPLSSPAPAQMDSSATNQAVRHKFDRRVVGSGPHLNADGLGAASTIQRSELIDHYSQSTIVQTGSGAPNWNLGNTAWLSWNGPVQATQTVRLLIAPPWLVRPLRIVLAALLAWLILRLFRNTGSGAVLRRPAAAAGALLLCTLAISAGARAQEYPGEPLLAQLRERLTEAPKCAPACAAFAEAQVTANGDTVSVALDTHAGERVAVPLPVDASATLKSIQVDAVAADAAWRDESGRLWVAVSRGVHRIQADFDAHGDKLSLAFALKPARVLFQGHGWEASGLADDRLLTETLSLARARDNAGTAPDTGVQQFPPYVRVVRSLSLGLEWSVSTAVTRVAPAQGGFTVELPLLPAEHVSSAGIKVQNGKIPMAIGDGQSEAGWQSTLDKGDALTLTAPALTDRAEVWRVLVSPTWHVEFSGVPGVGVDSSEDINDFRNFEFHPLSGETLTLRVTRPAPAQGGVRAIDAVSLHSETGQHASTHTLGLTVRASQGGDLALTLPKDAEMLGVTGDNVALNLRLLDGRLSLPVSPGAHRFSIRLRNPATAAVVVRSPQVGLGLAAANVSVSQQLPADRWLLATWGPPVGPAVLYWGELIVMIGVAFALARTQRTRLTFRDWLLLGLGFSTFSWLALLVVVVWLFAFDWRARGALPQARWQFNLLQAALVALTIVALLCLVSAIPQGLLGQPDMHVTGNASNAQSLHWFTDRSTDALPQPVAVSLPLWVYKVLMLAWAIWLANALIGWLRDGFGAWTRDGYWRARAQAAVIQADAPAIDANPPGTT
jgi:hypothetical protein